jgi:hypothetical protein
MLHPPFRTGERGVKLVFRIDDEGGTTKTKENEQNGQMDKENNKARKHMRYTSSIIFLG